MRTGNLVFLAGHIPRSADGEVVRGKLGADFTVEQGYEAAKLCCLGGLAVARRELGSLDRIRKRLGGVRYTELGSLMDQAFERDDPEIHRQWITKLVRDYYDPMYAYQLSRNKRQVVFSGDYGEVADYLSTRTMT